jgi:rare lipoprotein A
VRKKIAISLLVLASLASCVRVRPLREGSIQTGLASWYGPDFHGKPTSNKEIYNMYDLTAAHNTLPFGTQIMVTNLDNGKSVVVRINDRGPFVGNRIIDLSFAAARVLGMVGPGTAPVKIEVLKGYALPSSAQEYAVQVGAFISKNNALGLQRELQKIHKDVYISLFQTPNQTYYRVRIKARSRLSAQSIAEQLAAGGLPVILLEEQ